MPNRAPSSRRTVLLSILAVALALAVGAGTFFAVRAATFTDQASVPGNTFATDTLDPPTGLWASAVFSDIYVGWTHTTDTYATGYKVLRGTTSSGPYTQIATVTPRTIEYYYDVAPAPGIHYYYVVQTYFQNWLSVYSNQADVALPGNTGWRSPTAEEDVTSSSGDNDGFESNPTYAFADDASYAEDASSGTAGSQDCTSTARDRHQFYTYDFNIPSGSTIDGIEVRLDAWVDLGIDNPKMCVELSWDGGTTWTTGKTTANLTNSQQTYFLGSTSDTWGRPWSSTDFSDATFRLRITNIADSAVRWFLLDWVPVQVKYTPP